MTVTASNYALKENDLYETEPWAVYALIRSLKKLGLWRCGKIWEPAAGNHALMEPFLSSGANTVLASDIATYSKPHAFHFDFLSDDFPITEMGDFDLITNPPYGHRNFVASKFAAKALQRCPGVVALLLTAKFDFGSTRSHLFRDNPKFRAKLALTDRISWEGNGETGTEDHAWYIWGPVGGRRRQPVVMYDGREGCTFKEKPKPRNLRAIKK
ncbi:hypothetical protein WG622_18015 [Cognatishimia sp. D5M38]|uniref:Methyltransferase n=1 Tax=Cognatishimia coralii TaxID=3083254 RepID=A0ABU8QL72_9RHOB|nr:hypothetical protein [Donghicola eburneus]MCI5040722.1 hypothetical protein [Donghicola eburneus]